MNGEEKSNASLLKFTAPTYKKYLKINNPQFFMTLKEVSLKLPLF
jgi:hypothetical protein